MSTPDPTHLQDAELAPWQAERKPDPTPEEQGLILAAKLFVRIDDEVQHHPGPRSGPKYEALVARWRSLHAQLLGAARNLPGDPA